MTSSLHRSLLAALLVLWPGAGLAAQTLDQPSLRASPLPDGLVLDGRLRESAWATADSGVMSEFEPQQTATPADRTVIKVLASGDALVFGVRCDDPAPDRITRFARARDADLSSEDHVRIVLDPFLDGQAGYVFAVNPNGARYDALISEQAERLGPRENSSWDTIWQAAVARSATGWSVEIRIPVKSLLFRPGLTRWGFNVERRVQRNLETQRWAYPSRDWRITQMSRAGLLVDLPAFHLDRGLSVRPALVTAGGVAAPGAAADGTVTASLDATQRIGANTLAFLTVHTDFAESEVDERRTNVTRFSLYFPEKRSFFLEGTDIFDFGPGIAPDVVPFWSRRIGLLGGETVPLEVGTKETGRIGATSFGALAVRTGAVAGLAPATDMAVLRAKRNILRESSVGIISTVGDPTGAGGSWLAGADLSLASSRVLRDKNAQLGLWGLTMGRAGATGSTAAAGVSLSYPNDVWNNFLGYRWVGDGFQPALGFVPQPGVQQWNLALNYSPRATAPWLARWLYRATVELIGAATTDLRGHWLTFRGRFAPINLAFENGDHIAIGFHPEAERLDSAFVIAPGDTIAPGAYRFLRYRIDYERAAKRRVSWALSYWGGAFYHGSLRQFIGTVLLRPAPLLVVELSGERDQGTILQGSVRVPFVLERYGARLRVSTSPDFELDSFTQYDNASRQLGTDVRIRWTFSPSGDFFLVYTHNVDIPLGRAPWQFDSNRLSAKLQYAFRY